MLNANVNAKHVGWAALCVAAVSLCILLVPDAKGGSPEPASFEITAGPGEALSSESPPRIISSESDLQQSIAAYGYARKNLLSGEKSSRTLRITIIESRSEQVGRDMDLEWQNVATAMGHAASVVPQTTLNNTGFFSSTDLLIISSGSIVLSPTRRTTIRQFIEQGGPVYLQCEYQSVYTTDSLFEVIVNSYGGFFSWTGTVAGDLSPMTVLGSLSTIPNSVPSLSYFWYGCAGTGDATVEPFLEFQAQYFGFIFTPTNPGYGPVMTTTDQDWVMGAVSYPLMENIIYRLSVNIPPFSCGDVSGDGSVDITDLTYFVDYMFHGGPAPVCK